MPTGATLTVLAPSAPLITTSRYEVLLLALSSYRTFLGYALIWM